ncbi:MAG: TonB-dependent receptor, partial [Myxococcales bacterium]|nr:TonB-dependent receptor [Myxococcales bacterium]
MLVALLIALLAPPVEAPVVVTGQRPAERDVRDATLATEALEVEDDPRPRTDAGALLDRAVGARVQRGGGAGRAQTVQLRGAGGQQVAVLLDEVPLHTARGDAVDLATVPLGFLDRVEVVRSAAGALYGSAAQGGVIRLRTRRFEGPAADVTLRAGAFGLWQADAGAGGGNRALDGLVALSGSRAEGDFRYVDVNGDPQRRRNADHARFAGLARGRWRPGGGRELSALVEGLADERGEPGLESLPDLDARSQRRRLSAALGWRDPSAGGGVLPYRVDVHGQVRRFSFSDPTPAPGAGTEGALADLSLGARGEASYEGSAWQRPVLAIEGRREAAETTPGARDEVRHGGALSGAWEVDPLSALRLVAALRLDAVSGRDPLVVPKLGAAFRPIEPLRLRANLGRLFRDPSLDELYFEAPGVRGNPDLRPEDGYGWDAGFTFAASVLQVDAQVFGQRYERLIVFVPIDAWRVQARADHGATVDGVEVGLRAAWPAIELDATWLYQDARFDAPLDTPLPLRPRHRLTGRALLPVGPAALFAHMRWQSEVTADRFGARTLPAYALFDLGAAGPVPLPAPGQLRLSVEFRNVLDVRD